MARVKLSEFQAKTILLPHYLGLSATPKTTLTEITRTFPDTNLVVKLDQGIKKRGQRGLVRVNCTPRQVISAIQEWSDQGWRHFLVEPVIEHAPEAERYLALERMRDGWQLSYSDHGGVEVESSWDSLQTVLVPNSSDLSAIRTLSLPKGKDRSELSVLLETLPGLISILEKHHLSFLEMNPVIIRASKLIPLDMAAQLDDTALGLAELVPLRLTPIQEEGQSQLEQDIAALDATTPASLKFKLINPAGSIWMLLSGGGASLVLADEVADQGMGPQLANYGEYSGAPTDDDVYSYTRLILKQMLSTKSKPQPNKRALVIAAGVANFTDVAKTFAGIIRALSEVQKELKKARVKVFVRRGGPNEARGLKLMADFLTGASIPHLIHTHETPLTQVISDVNLYLGSPSSKRSCSTGSDLEGRAQPDIEKQSGGKVRS